MATTIETSQVTADVVGSLPITIQLDDFHKAATEVYVHYLRNVAILTQDSSALSLLGLPIECVNGYDIFNPDMSAAEIGVTYEHICQTPFAKTLNLFYDFAFFARLDMTAEGMGDETTYTFISTLLADAAYGYAADNWDAFGNPIMDHAKACLLVAEIANARWILEGGNEPFFHFAVYRDRDKIDDAVGFGALTIRQMTLLSGMEEQSVRAAANPKRANRLVTHNEDGRTLVELGLAKAWLQSKGRHIPITRYVPDDGIDLATQSFNNTGDLIAAINHRYNFQVSRGTKSIIDAQIAAAGMEATFNISREPGLFIAEDQINDGERMKALALILEWPADLFSLRCKEAAAKATLTAIERELRSMNHSTLTKQKGIM